MPTRRRQRFVHAQAAWMFATLLLLAILGVLSVELYFVVSLVGLLLIVQLTSPFNVTPQWRTRLKWLIIVGLLGFGYVIVRRLLTLLPEGLL